MNNPMIDRMMRDRKMRRDYRDERNPYGSRGGYVSSTRDYDYREDYRYNRDYNADYRRDYNYRGMNDRLNPQELEELSYKLMKVIPNENKDVYRKETIIHKATEHGVRFERFTEDEFYTVVLMMYSDFYKTLGTSNIDIYIRLANDWLNDSDVAHRYSDKLVYYYDYIINE